MNAAPVRLGSRRIVTPDGVVDGVLEIDGGAIARVIPAREAAGLAGVEHFGDHALLPGLVDTHVHINEPGRAEWEGFATGTRAALAGGVTTIVDMPLNSVPATTNVAALRAKQEAAREHAVVDVGFWGGVVPGNVGELEPLAEAGVLGFKCFMVDSGVPEFAAVSEADLREAMPVLARLGLPLLAHAELPGPIAAAAASLAGADPRAYATWLASRPREAEVEAIRLLIRLCEETGCHVHVVHLAAPEALDDLCDARMRGLPITSETCPHYLFFHAESIPDGATAFKCAPPIRERAVRERLWQALRDGHIDLIATDHSPCPPEMKRMREGDFMRAWGGIASLEVGLAAIWTEAAARGFTLADVARWIAQAPAALAGLTGVKGAIAPGADADLVVFDTEAEWTMDASRLHQRHPVTPYAGRELRGRVLETWRAGRRVHALMNPRPQADNLASERDAGRLPLVPPRLQSRASNPRSRA